MKISATNYHIIVIKIGSSLIVDNGKIRLKWLENFISNIKEILDRHDCRIIIVSSGAVALGKIKLKLLNQKLSIRQKQACASVGQIDLISLYKDLFQSNNMQVAQILLTATDCNSRNSYLNCKNTLETLLENNVIPIINENDSIAVDEIKIGDNDRLSARVAQMVGADLMILLSDIDGLYDCNPKINPHANFINHVEKIDENIEKMAQGAGSSVGTGGMITKIMAVKMVAKSNCDAIITSGIEEDALKNLISGDKKFTLFINKKDNKKSKHNSSARKNWLSGLFNPKGSLIINDKAVEALRSKKASLLAVGVESIVGEFSKGDAVIIKDKNNLHIANGIANHSSDIIVKILHKNSDEIKYVLGSAVKPEIVHIDNLVLIN